MRCECCQSNDLASGRSSILLWYLPAVALFLGLAWRNARPWLWIPAFLIMGVGCLVNVSRCGRLHCYITGPVFLLAGAYVVLAEFSLLPMDGRIFLLAVLGITTLACLAELPLREIQEGRLEVVILTVWKRR